MAQAVSHDDRYTARLTRLTLTWVLVALVLFPVLAVLGFLMRLLQAGFFAATAARMVLRGDDAARPRAWWASGSSPGWRASACFSRALRAADARRLVDRVRRNAGWRRAAARGHAGRAGWASAGSSSTRCRFTRAARGRAWATASLFAALAIMGVGLDALGRRSALGHRAPIPPVGRARLAVSRADATRRRCPPIIIIATVSFIGVLRRTGRRRRHPRARRDRAAQRRLHQRRAPHQEPDVLLRSHAGEHHDVFRRGDGLRDHARVHRTAVEDEQAGRGIVEPRCCCS